MAGPTMQDVLAARDRLAGVAHRTPLEHSDWLSALAGADVYLKLECFQRTRSFKLRGAYNAVAAMEDPARARGVTVASAGNHGLGVALAAREHGARASIFVPADAPDVKKRRIAALGADLREVHGGYDAAERACVEHARRTGAEFIHPCADERVVAGQGTVGLEILEDLPGLAELVVPVGGGGLLAGCAIAARALGRGTRILGVQSEQTRTMHDSLAGGRPVEDRSGPTLADGLAGGIDAVSLDRVRDAAARLELVPEPAIARAIRGLFVRHGVVAEGSGAVAIAAVCEGRFDLRGPSALVISGGNIDPDRFSTLLAGD